MDLVAVTVFDNDAEAELARGLLEANGIHASFSGGVASAPPELAIGRGVPMGTVLQVAHKDLKRATEILSKANKHRGETFADREWREQKKTIYRIRRYIIYFLLALPFAMIAFALICQAFRGK